MAKLSVSCTPMRRSASSSSEQRLLLGVVGLRRIARRRADAAVFLADQVLVGEGLVRRVAPELLAHALVHALGEGLGDAVGQRLDQDRAVIVVRALEALGDAHLLDARPSRRSRRHSRRRPLSAGATKSERQRFGRPSRFESCWRRPWKVASVSRAALAGEEADVVADRVRRPEADHRLRVEPALLDDACAASPARPRRAGAPPRPASRPRGSPGSGPSAPRSGRTASSRCSGTSSATS